MVRYLLINSQWFLGNKICLYFGRWEEIVYVGEKELSIKPNGNPNGNPNGVPKGKFKVKFKESLVSLVIFLVVVCMEGLSCLSVGGKSML